MLDLVKANQHGERCAAGHAVFLVIDQVEQGGLIEVGGALEIARELRPAAVEQPQTGLAVGAEGRGEPVDSAPARLEGLQPRMMQDRVAGSGELVVDLGDVAVDGQPDRLGRHAPNEAVPAEPGGQARGRIAGHEGFPFARLPLGLPEQGE